MSILDRRSFLTTTAAGLASLKTARGMTQPADEEDPLGVRAEFPAARNQTFLNTAWVGPIPQVARDAGVAYADETLVWADSRNGQDIDHLKRLLNEEAIAVSFREANQALMRVSVSMFNNRADIQRLLTLLEKVA